MASGVRLLIKESGLSRLAMRSVAAKRRKSIASSCALGVFVSVAEDAAISLSQAGGRAHL
jgi:hypothetical protein